ncbi:RNB domain-containing ribonuclease [Nocardioides seonyuensis]|uniref:RNB domain-containing ribonuclease n=1 Tax=Nocardioides seonyuensis TaxID=2518371 RepID=A0A4P7IIY5_9ACTN|nr:RNB domain-containing ribonuclease [Nocardioides seonyuensis]QBX56670.1 RNB domain-containing ribonuclease [Nocardioides seonyuensis]
MPSNRVISVRAGDDAVQPESLREGIAAIQAELGLSTEFPDDVERAAAAAAASPRLPDLDLTHVPFVTIDPESAQDLDQAMYLERDGDGYVVRYAIADLTAFITPGDPIDVEANRRGETLYGADSKIPLHPKVISEDAGSLLPDEVRPALVWTIKVDATGEGTDANVERALVRSRAKLDYASLQEEIDAGTADEMFTILREVGELRIAREAARGGVSLPLPEQEIVDEDGTWRLEFRSMAPVESWNAQISLLTGFAAASLMVYARVGLLRTLPPVDHRDITRLHRTAKALKIEWPAEQLYPDFIRSLDPAEPNHAAMVVACTRILRGSGYVGFDGELPEQAQHSALASEYAHVTAPLRRLVDRYALEICVALCADQDVPGWVLEKLHELPDTMRESSRRANQYENAILNLVEAAVLAPRVGEEFSAVVVEVDEKDDTRGDVTVQEPAIEAGVVGSGPLPVGEEVSVRLTTADVETRKVEFTL